MPVVIAPQFIEQAMTENSRESGELKLNQFYHINNWVIAEDNNIHAEVSVYEERMH